MDPPTHQTERTAKAQRFDRAAAMGVTTAAAAVGAPMMLSVLLVGASWTLGVSAWIFLLGLGLAAGLEAFASTEAGVSDRPVQMKGDAAAIVLAVLTGLILLAMTLLALRTPASVFAPPTAAGGAVLMAVGAGLRFSAVRRLGGRFTSDNAVVPGAALEQDGIYRVLAHPSEVGLALLGVGGLCLTPGAGFAALLAALMGLQVWRVLIEERALLSHYGDMYFAYRRRTFDPFPSVLLIAGGRGK